MTAPDATQSPPPTPTPAAAPAPAPAPAPATDPAAIVSVNEATYNRIATIFAIALALCTVGIVGVLCFRVAVDGNAPLTTSITTDLADNVKWLVIALAAVILGKNAINALIAKFAGGA